MATDLMMRMPCMISVSILSRASWWITRRFFQVRSIITAWRVAIVSGSMQQTPIAPAHLRHMQQASKTVATAVGEWYQTADPNHYQRAQ